MFDNCVSLTEINLANFITNNVTDMNAMFYECTSLTKVDLSNFDMTNVTDMNCMFGACKSTLNIIAKDKKLLDDKQTS